MGFNSGFKGLTALLEENSDLKFDSCFSCFFCVCLRLGYLCPLSLWAFHKTALNLLFP